MTDSAWWPHFKSTKVLTQFERIINLMHANWDLVEKGVKEIYAKKSTPYPINNFSLMSQQLYAEFYKHCQKKDLHYIEQYINTFKPYLPASLIIHLTKLMQQAVSAKEK